MLRASDALFDSSITIMASEFGTDHKELNSHQKVDWPTTKSSEKRQRRHLSIVCLDFEEAI